MENQPQDISDNLPASGAKPLVAAEDMTQDVAPNSLPPSNAKKAGEPIFNHLPAGVVSVIVVILLAYGFQKLAPLFLSDSQFNDVLMHMVIIPAAQIPSVMATDGFGVGQLTLFDRISPYFGYQFLHAGPVHLMMNLAMLMQTGPITERAMSEGKDSIWRFWLFFLLSGAAGALFYVALNPLSQTLMVGASGSISGVFAGFVGAAFVRSAPNSPLRRTAYTSAAIFLFLNVGLAAAARVTDVVPIAWEAHLGGFLGGLMLWPLLAKKQLAEQLHI